MRRGLIIGGSGVAFVLVALGVALLIWAPWRNGNAGAPAPTPKSVAPSPAVASRPVSPQTQAIKPPATPLSTAMKTVVSRAPAKTFCLVYMDLERTAKSVGEIPLSADAPATTVAQSKLWQDAAARIKEGDLPATAAIYLTTEFKPATEMFGSLYGLMPGADKPATETGLWPLVSKQAPDFLLYMTGPAANTYCEAITA